MGTTKNNFLFLWASKYVKTPRRAPPNFLRGNPFKLFSNKYRFEMRF